MSKDLFSGTLCVREGTVVTPEGMKKADVCIENGIIVSVGGEARKCDREYDASGCLVMPGFIDAHTHFLPGGKNSRSADDFVSGTQAALAGGDTTIIDFAEQEKGGTLSDGLNLWHETARGKCACDYGFHMTVTDWNDKTKSEISDMVSAGVTSFKAYMANDKYRISDNDIKELFRETGRLGCLTGIHCELGDEASSRSRFFVSSGKALPNTTLSPVPTGWRRRRCTGQSPRPLRRMPPSG